MALSESRRRGGPHPLDLGGDELRRRLGLDHRRRPAEHRGRAARRDPGPAEGQPAQQGALAHARRRGVPGAVPGGRARRARRAVRARDRGLDPEREDQRRRLLDLVRQRPGDRRAADAQLVDRPARAEGVGRRRDRHLRDLRRHPRDGRQPDRLHGPGRLPRLGLPLGRRPADRQRPRLPGAAGELHGDAHLAALPGGRAGADDPARRRSCARSGSSARPCTRAATAPATTSRATSRRTTTRPSAR